MSIKDLKFTMDYRPNFHFSPKQNWMNDPNGLFFLNGNYHLFFQYYPGGMTWGPMHWGHAISKDLMKWEEKPIALDPDEKGYIFSGSAVVDLRNTSGFGSKKKSPIVAIFTYHNAELENEGSTNIESQALAFSLDEGTTWSKYSGNPVLESPGLKDFRDPKVFWYEADTIWIMVLSTYEKTLIYKSPDLKNWDFCSDFGENLGAHGGVWECPDLFPLQIENTDEEKWVLLQSLNPGHCNHGSGTQYFIGDFDGKHFKIDPGFESQLELHGPFWVDYGRDNYAGVTWSNIPESDGRRIMIGWMSNWDYANKTPTETWRNTMTVPRTLSLKRHGGLYILASYPVVEMHRYMNPIKVIDDINRTRNLFDSSQLNLNVCHFKMTLRNIGTSKYSFRLYSAMGKFIEFGIDLKSGYYFFDRSQSGNTEFSENFVKGVSKAPLFAIGSHINLEIVIDKTSIEVFWNDGATVFTELFYFFSPAERLEFLKPANSAVDLKIVEANEIVM